VKCSLQSKSWIECRINVDSFCGTWSSQASCASGRRLHRIQWVVKYCCDSQLGQYSFMSQLWEIGLSPLAQCIVIPSTVAHELNTPIGNCCSEPNTLSARHCHKHAELHRIARQITSRREGGSAWSDLARHVFSRPVHWLMLVVRWRLRPSLQAPQP